ncbi:MAG: co-chaperone GroES family protein [Prevotellaceae bacterium]|jgi:co-chaperonin GroES (HSP10)|nr:co-chaperone GroES family protein [Prevotellaceae bacterium]
MINSFETDNFSNVAVVGDRVLIKPESEKVRTRSGLFLPAGVQEKEKVLSGYVVKCGPGYPIPSIGDEDEAWKKTRNEVKYLPLQARPGDFAVFLQTGIHEIYMNNEKYFIVPNSSLLVLIQNGDFET